MKKMMKSRKENADASCSFSCLPDEIIFQILNKLIDLKSLCCCYLVSKRFSSIVLEVEAISFTAPNVADIGQSRPLPPELFGESFLSWYRFLNKFKVVKSLCIELSSSNEIIVGMDDSCLFKWKVIKFGKRIESFLFLWPNSICDKDGFQFNEIEDEDEDEDEEKEDNLLERKHEIALQCLNDVKVRHMMLLYLVKDLPMLEEVSITDSERRGRLSLSGEKLSQMKKELLHNSASETVINSVEEPPHRSEWYVYELNLPVSGYMMKGVYCLLMKMEGVQGGNDGLMSSEIGFEGKEGVVYTEALMEILGEYD